MPESSPKPAYGGQAVIEGVVIRGKTQMAVACRRKDGSITVESKPLHTLLERYPWLNRPFLRGTFALWDSLSMGFGALLWSANLALEDEGEKQLSSKGFGWTIVASFVVGIALFVVLPSMLPGLLPRVLQVLHLEWLRPQPGAAHAFWSNLTETAIRLVVFVIYVVAIMQLQDVKRLFAYHGAEHKVINAFEHGDDSGDVQSYDRIHRRCGTVFIAVVIVVGFAVHLAMGWPVWYLRILSRLLVLPVIAGISYEVIRLAGRSDHWLLTALIWPGTLIQRLTTREPTEDMIEVARASLRAARVAEGELPEAGTAS